MKIYFFSKFLNAFLLLLATRSSRHGKMTTTSISNAPASVQIHASKRLSIGNCNLVLETVSCIAIGGFTSARTRIPARKLQKKGQ